MSLLQELGAQLRATSDELPTDLVTIAMERLRTATELLMWVRQESVDPMGVPQLGNATEHAERAAAALRLAQDTIAGYLAVLGLNAGPGAAPGAGDWKAGLRPAEGGTERPAGDTPPPDQLGPWWQQRVKTLTGEDPPPPEAGARPADTAELLRRVAAGVRSGDRARLGRDLHAVAANTGLALSAVTPPVLHRLAGDLLGHEPGPADLDRLRSTSAGRVRSLLPGTPPAVLDTLLARICRSPDVPADRGHPADAAVTAGVLTGVLLARLGRDPASLDPSAPEPLRRGPVDPPPPARPGPDDAGTRRPERVPARPAPGGSRTRPPELPPPARPGPDGPGGSRRGPALPPPARRDPALPPPRHDPALPPVGPAPADPAARRPGGGPEARPERGAGAGSPWSEPLRRVPPSAPERRADA